MGFISMTRLHLEENLQPGTSPENIAGNLKSVSNLTGRALLPISIRKPLVPQGLRTFLEWSWEASYLTYLKTLASMYWPSICYSATQSGRHRKWPQGRWYPYVGGGLGAQRASLTILGYQETSYAPAVQGLIGIKFFLIKNLAIFGEVKRTTGRNKFDYEGAGAPPDYFEKYTITSNHFVAGVALHF
jgi:hypothetical protein